jgi:hypothetical protein
MISDDGRRWRALRAWFDDFPPDDQERLLGQMERPVALAQDRDMGAFFEWVDALLVRMERHEQLNPWAPERRTWGDGPREGLQSGPYPAPRNASAAATAGAGRACTPGDGPMDACPWHQGQILTGVAGGAPTASPAVGIIHAGAGRVRLTCRPPRASEAPLRARDGGARSRRAGACWSSAAGAGPRTAAGPPWGTARRCRGRRDARAAGSGRSAPDPAVATRS